MVLNIKVMEQIKIIEVTAIPQARTHTHPHLYTHTNESVHLPKKTQKTPPTHVDMWMLKTISNTYKLSDKYTNLYSFNFECIREPFTSTCKHEIAYKSYKFETIIN